MKRAIWRAYANLWTLTLPQFFKNTDVFILFSLVDSVTTPSLLPSLYALLLLVPLVAVAVSALLWRQKHISDRGESSGVFFFDSFPCSVHLQAPVGCHRVMSSMMSSRVVVMNLPLPPLFYSQYSVYCVCALTLLVTILCTQVSSSLCLSIRVKQRTSMRILRTSDRWWNQIFSLT